VRARYLIAYDIVDDERRTRVFTTLRGAGDHLQYSVFRCDLSERERVALVARLHALIDHDDDQILLVDLGPVDGRAATCVTALGRSYIPPERTVLVL
jgi:CRISPR-associated protein Cas2